ncbi:MAG: MFS transporter [Nocardioides sp.]
MSPALRGRRGLTFAVLAVSVSSFALLQSLIVPVLATIEQELDTDQATVTWVLTAYLLSASIATPLLGRVGDVVGKTRMLVITLSALAVGSLMAAVAPSIGWLIAARVVQGAGGGVLPLAFGIVRDEFGERMTGALSVLASLTAVGFGFGIVVAGPIVDVFGYTGLFWLPMIATTLAAVATLLLIPPSPIRTPSRLPLLPAVLLAVWLVALLLALSEGNAWGWTSPRILGLFATAAAGLTAWVAVETRVPVPMIDMQMMRRRGVWTTNAVAMGVGFGMFAAFAFLPQFLQTPEAAGYGFGATISESGRLLLPSAVASFVVGFATARLIRLFGARSVIVTGCALMALAFAGIALWHDSTWQLYVATTVQGFGSGLVFSSIAGVVITSVPAHQTGVASGMNANIRTIGGSVGAAVMAGVVTAQHGPLGYPAESGYTAGFLLLALAMVAAAGAAWFIPGPLPAQVDATDQVGTDLSVGPGEPHPLPLRQGPSGCFIRHSDTMGDGVTKKGTAAR